VQLETCVDELLRRVETGETPCRVSVTLGEQRGYAYKQTVSRKVGKKFGYDGHGKIQTKRIGAASLVNREMVRENP
jgi:hypothetical protein